MVDWSFGDDDYLATIEGDFRNADKVIRLAGMPHDPAKEPDDIMQIETTIWPEDFDEYAATLAKNFGGQIEAAEGTDRYFVRIYAQDYATIMENGM